MTPSSGGEGVARGGRRVVLWSMVTSLPGLDRLVPLEPVPLRALLGGAVTLGIVAALASAAVALTGESGPA